MTESKILSPDQKEFIRFFMEAELPVMVSQDQLPEFSQMNEPFSAHFLEEIMASWENEPDEFTEYIPCFYLPVQENFLGLVYWKGGLLKYEFILVTINKKGELISRKPIASTIAEGDFVKQSAAYIDPDLNITILAGQNREGALYDPSLTQKFSMEILFNGEIILHLDNN